MNDDIEQSAGNGQSPKIRLERIVMFSDAVVAIAITLLILPLVDQAANIGQQTAGHFLSTNASHLWAFALSFLVIAQYWYTQHKFYASITNYNTWLLWSGFLWLISIVFLPFPTELLQAGNAQDRGPYVLYVATLAVTAFAALLQQIVVTKFTELKVDPKRGNAGLHFGLVFLVVILVALACTAFVSSIGLWSLLFLTASRPINHFVRRARASTRSN